MEQPNWLLVLAVSIALSGLVGFLASLLANAAYQRILRPELSIEIDPSNPHPDTRPSVGQFAFYHVLAISSGQPVPILGHRRLPKVVRAQVTIMDTARKVTLIEERARWAGWPEPIAMVPVPGITVSGSAVLSAHADPKEIGRQRSFDYESPDQREQIDIVLKVENEQEIRFWNNESYRHGGTLAKIARFQLGLGHYDVCVTLQCEGRTWRRWFRLSNGGRSWRDVSLVPLS